jgi:hypothetical protein
LAASRQREAARCMDAWRTHLLGGHMEDSHEQPWKIVTGRMGFGCLGTEAASGDAELNMDMRRRNGVLFRVAASTLCAASWLPTEGAGKTGRRRGQREAHKGASGGEDKRHAAVARRIGCPGSRLSCQGLRASASGNGRGAQHTVAPAQVAWLIRPHNTLVVMKAYPLFITMAHRCLSEVAAFDESADRGGVERFR